MIDDNGRPRLINKTTPPLRRGGWIAIRNQNGQDVYYVIAHGRGAQGEAVGRLATLSPLGTWGRRVERGKNKKKQRLRAHVNLCPPFAVIPEADGFVGSIGPSKCDENDDVDQEEIPDMDIS